MRRYEYSQTSCACICRMRSCAAQRFAVVCSGCSSAAAVAAAGLGRLCEEQEDEEDASSPLEACRMYIRLFGDDTF